MSTFAASAATAAITVNPGTIGVTLTNADANPTDISQAISDLTFTISNGTTAGATLFTSSSGQLTVNTGGTFTLGGTGATGWNLDIINSTTFELVDPASDHLILGPPGPGGYTNANSSIAGNASNNPFLDQIATFTINDSNVTADTTIARVTFSFGEETPLPAALPLFATGIGGLGLLGWRRKRKAQAVA